MAKIRDSKSKMTTRMGRSKNNDNNIKGQDVKRKNLLKKHFQ